MSEDDFVSHQMQVKEEARHLNIRFAVLWTTSVALVVVIPLIALFFYARSFQNQRITDAAEVARQNAKTIARVDDLRYDLCVQGEERDAVVVEQLQATIARVRATLPPGELRSMQIQTLLDEILTLEPPGELPCVPPRGTTP